MMETKFTPGPWRVGNQNGYNADYVQTGDGNGIAQVYGIPMRHRINEVPGEYEERLANAYLIAAAPELFEALQELLCPYGIAEVGITNAPFASHTLFIEAVSAARAALAKATGEQS